MISRRMLREILSEYCPRIGEDALDFLENYFVQLAHDIGKKASLILDAKSRRILRKEDVALVLNLVGGVNVNEVGKSTTNKAL